MGRRHVLGVARRFPRRALRPSPSPRTAPESRPVLRPPAPDEPFSPDENLLRHQCALGLPRKQTSSRRVRPTLPALGFLSCRANRDRNYARDLHFREALLLARGQYL